MSYPMVEKKIIWLIIVVTLTLIGCADFPSKSKVTTYESSPQQVQTFNKADWHYIRLEENNALAIKGFKPFIGDMHQLTVLEGWLPMGRDIGFEKLASARIRSFFFNCNSPAVALLGTTVRDLNLNIIYQQGGKSLTSVFKESDSAIKDATVYVCAKYL